METLGNDFVAKSGKEIEKKYYCEKCDYECCKLYNWKKHVATAKHNMEIIGNGLVAKSGKKGEKYSCEKCEKYFQTNAGLWKHKQKCDFKDSDLKPEIKTQEIKTQESNKDDLINYLIKENQEFKNLILEIVKKDTYNTTNNTNISNNNKSFNLNVFLNETCKDAMNIMDFVESIKLQLSDLERVGELGYVEGISNIIIKSLKNLDVSQRPVHCTDKKREIIYIKDEDKWEKDEEQKKMHKIVRKVADKNARMILKYKEVHPDCGTYHSKFSDQYNKIIVEAMGGSGDNDFEKEEKIIRNVSKQIGIEKE
jgi:hypothetical protein